MFGLSTQEVEMKNVLAAYSNCSSFYYDGIKKIGQLFDGVDDQQMQNLLSVVRKRYFGLSKDKLFEYLRTQYSDFDKKFENALKTENTFVDFDRLNQYISEGFSAGVLFYYVYYAITGKYPKISNCTFLSHQVNDIMDEVLHKLDNEMKNV